MRDHPAVEGKVGVLDGVGGHHGAVHLHHGLHGGLLGLIHSFHAAHHAGHVHALHHPRHPGLLDRVLAALRQDRQVRHGAPLSRHVARLPPGPALLSESRGRGEKGSEDGG